MPRASRSREMLVDSRDGGSSNSHRQTSPGESANRSEIQERLLDWYQRNQRTLPWRDVVDPYAVLVSEIMLQQTGVDRVRPIYERFLSEFPTFEALARAPRVQVLRAWAGLGYNRRAVNLHECAKIVIQDHGGILPCDPAILGRLPGIGPYTASAIRSFVFREDVAAIDTNVRRVVGRVVLGPGASDRAIAEAAALLLPPGKSADWNQALMDLGAMRCTAVSPECGDCPLEEVCQSASLYRAARPLRRVAERSEPYVHSRRYRRGRIVAFLREQSAGSVVPLGDVAGVLDSDQTDGAMTQAESLVRSLAADGLARVVVSDQGVFVGPPL